MQRINLDEDIVPVSTFRSETAALIDRIRTSGRSLVLTQRGRGAVVVIDVAEYERIREELDLLRDIHRAETQLEKGLGLSRTEARDRIRARCLPEKRSGS